MWLDNASEIDILFYEPHADVIADIAKNKNYNPLTIGIFGVWGAGKSTLLNLVQQKIGTKESNSKKTICININAWTFEGYEDAKIALMEALLRELKEKEGLPEKVGDKIKALLKKLDVFKIATKAISVGAPIAASALTGNPLPLVLSLSASPEDIGNGVKKAADTLQTIREDYWKADKSNDDETSIVNNVRKFRAEFSEALDDDKIDNVIVLIDDLDRCQPDRIIETLEAIKLFLSVKKMTFIVAVDENVIQYAIRKKYPPLENYAVNLDKEYIEKIIQLPIYIPELSSRDIENYLMLLVAQNYCEEQEFVNLLRKIKESGIMISEEIIDKAKLEDLANSFLLQDQRDEFKELVDVIDGIKGIVAYNLKGNPRQAKRFLNTFITKKRLAELYYGKNAINSKILAKILVLQKLDNDLFIQLNEWNKNFTTENEGFKSMRLSVAEGSEEEKYAPWKTGMISRWLESEPVELENERLDRYFYLTRESLKKAEVDESMLSIAAKDILQRIGASNRALIDSVIDEMKNISTTDQNSIFNVLLPKIEKGDLPLFKIRSLFVGFSFYRDKIISSLEKTMMKVKLGDVAAIKTMRSSEQEKMDALLEVWLKRGIIDEKEVATIKNTEKK